jgi:hypothetical protein
MTAVLEGYLFYEIAALLVLAAGVGFIGLMLRQPLDRQLHRGGHHRRTIGPQYRAFGRADRPAGRARDRGSAVPRGPEARFQPRAHAWVRVALVTGLGQVIFTTVFGFLIGLALGLDPRTAVYVAIALTFSSTIIIVKLLSDKREIDSLHGRIALGFLIVQDVVVVLAMIVLSAIGVGAAADGQGALGDVLRVLGFGLAMLAFVIVFIRYVANPLVERPVTGAGAPGFLRDRLGRLACCGGPLPRLREGTGRATCGRFPCLDPVSGGDCRTACLAPGLPSAVLLHRTRRVARPFGAWRQRGACDNPVALRPDRKPTDRTRHHGGHGLPQADRVPGRADRRTDQRVLTDLHGHGCRHRSCRERGARACHPCRSGDHSSLHLHDNLFASALFDLRAAARDLRTQSAGPRPR